jgi:hypothetical protein
LPLTGRGLLGGRDRIFFQHSSSLAANLFGGNAEFTQNIDG